MLTARGDESDRVRGLALSLRLARDMGATLKLEDTDGEGASFVLGLRVRD